MENTFTHILLLFVVVFYFHFYIVMEKCNFLSIVISFVRNIGLLYSTYLTRASDSLNFLGRVLYKIKIFKILYFFVFTLLSGMLENEKKLEEKCIRV